MWTKSTDNSKLEKSFFYVYPQISVLLLGILFYSKRYLLSDNDGIRTHNYLVRKWTLSHITKLACLRDMIITQSNIYYIWKLTVKRFWDLRISIQQYQFGHKTYQNSAGLKIWFKLFSFVIASSVTFLCVSLLVKLDYYLTYL